MVARDVTDKLALEQYEAFNHNRLEIEAKEETFADDEELRNMELVIKSKKKRGFKDGSL